MTEATPTHIRFAPASRAMVLAAVDALGLGSLTEEVAEVRITADVVQVWGRTDGRDWTASMAIDPSFSVREGSPRLPSASFARVGQESNQGQDLPLALCHGGYECGDASICRRNLCCTPDRFDYGQAFRESLAYVAAMEKVHEDRAARRTEAEQ